VNRYDFARAVFDAAGLRSALTPTASADFPTPAERPKNAVLDTGRLQTIFGVEPPDWRAALQDVVADLMSREEAKA
jgi:dTDP-4-dehydrorhamnose reductase